MSADLGSHESMIRKLLDQAAITYDGKEYKHVEATRPDLYGTAGNYRNSDNELITHNLPGKIHCKVEITFTESAYNHLETSESVKSSKLESSEDKIKDIRKFARALIEEWLKVNKIEPKEDGSEEEKREYEENTMAAFKENGVKVVITVKNSDDVISIGSEDATKPLDTPESVSETADVTRKSESDTTVNEFEVERKSASDEEYISTSSQGETKVTGPERRESKPVKTYNDLIGAKEGQNLDNLIITEYKHFTSMLRVCDAYTESEHTFPKELIPIYFDFDATFNKEGGFNYVFYLYKHGATDYKINNDENNNKIILRKNTDGLNKELEGVKKAAFSALHPIYSKKYFNLSLLKKIYSLLKKHTRYFDFETQSNFRDKINPDSAKIKQIIKYFRDRIQEISEEEYGIKLDEKNKISDDELTKFVFNESLPKVGGRKTRKNRKNKTKRKRNNKLRKSKKHKKQSKRC